MKQRSLTKEEQNQVKPLYPEVFQLRETGFGGFLYTFSEQSLQDDTPEEVEQFFESLWQAGGFRCWLGTYKDVFFDPQTNRVAYDFWAKKVRARIHDETLRDKLAPLEPPHAFGVKRPSLELGYFEQFNKQNVHLVDVSDNAIARFTETGLQLADGTTHDFDVIAVATGLDVSTGGLMEMGLHSLNGTTLKDGWRDSVSTYLGLCISGYPNMFMMYGPQAPQHSATARRR
jgi:cation diffusion facilitator CzcD-associated flavoprotein CzcO